MVLDLVGDTLAQGVPIWEMLNTMLGGVWPSSTKDTLTGSKFSIQIWFVHIR